MTCIWAMPLNNIWRCPRCGELCSYGGRRSRLSILPGICRHLVIDYTPLIKRGHDSKGLAYIDVGPSMSNDSLRNSRLMKLLSDEIKGYRKHWWGPYTQEEKARRNER